MNHGELPTYGEETTLRVPALAPGRYQLCVAPRGKVLDPGPERRCVDGELADGGEVVLDASRLLGE